jgi:glycosyltransferase involved in cell wall biosynthesis
LRSKIVKSLDDFDCILAVSKQVKNSILSLNQNLTNKIKVLPNIVDRDVIISKSLQFDAKFQKNEINLVFVGRIEKVKGLDRVLNCVQKLIKQDLRFCFHIVGDGSEKLMLEKITRDRQLSNYVLFHGFQDNPYPYIAAADIFVLSSYNEGYPMVLPEAMVLGKAILTTKVSGTAEILNDGEYGLIVENSEEALCNGLEKLLSSESDRIAFATKAKQGAQNFNAENFIRDFETILSSSKIK